MAKLKKLKSSKISKENKKSRKVGVSVKLPKKKNKPSDKLVDYSILLYGAKKIGKTSLASHFPDAYFLSTEPGTKALEVFASPVSNWKEFDAYLDLLEKDGDGSDFSTIVVDTVDILYEYAFKFICDKEMIEDPNEMNDYGKTWKKIKKTFADGILRLLNLDKGVILISHDVEKEVELRNGDTVDRVQPTMSRQAMEVVEAIVDIICNYSYTDDKRTLRIDGTQTTVAGCRLENNFIVKGKNPRSSKGRVITIDMGDTSSQSYENFKSAFNNKQESQYAPGTEPIKKKKKKKLKKKGK